jgi:hypothetical protein
MNEAASEADFEVQLRAEGYTEVEIKEYAPRAGHGRHRHHFAVKGLVLSGAFIVQQGDDPVTFSPSAANPKFAPQLQRVRLRTSGSKRH